DVEASGQRGGAMTRVLELLFGYTAGLNGLVGGIAFDSLERRRLIHAHRVSAVESGLAWGIEIRLADCGGLALEGVRILLRRVEPHLRAMWLKRRLLQVAAHLCNRDALHDLAFDHLVPQFSVRPTGDRTPRQLRRLARHGQNLRDLLGGDFPRTPWTRRVGQDFEDSFTEPVRLGALPDAQRLPSISPPFPPHADLLPVQPDFLRNLLVQEPLNSLHQNQRTLHNPLRLCARPTEFLQNRQLLLADPDLCRCPWHSSPPRPHNRGSGRSTQISDFLKPRFRVAELAAGLFPQVG